MPTIRAVEHALLRAGIARATGTTAGFQALALERRIVVVRWRQPGRERNAAATVAALEEYAPLLREAGFCAVLATDGPEPRVLCLPRPAIGAQARQASAVRDAS